MKFGKNSFFFKITFYNDIAIILTSLIISSILMIIIFRNLDINLYKSTELNLKLLKNKFQSIALTMEDDASKLGNTREIYRAIYQKKLSKSNDPIYDKEKDIYYYTYKDITKKKRKIYYLNLARNLKLNLYGSDTYEDSETILSILDENGDILGESRGLEIDKSFSIKKEADFRKKILRRDEIFNQNKLKLNTISYNEKEEELALIAGSIVGYNRLGSSAKGALVLTRRIGHYFIENISKEAGMSEQTKIIFLYKQNYLVGELDLKKGYKLLDDSAFKKIIENNLRKYTEEKKINNEEYYISYYPLLNLQGEIISFFGIASSKKQLLDIKMMTFSLIGAMTILIILFSTSLYSKLIKKLVDPIYEIIEVSKKVTSGNFDVELQKEGEGETKILHRAYQNMLTQIKETQSSLKNKNERLIKNIKTLNIIEKTSSLIYAEENIDKVLYYTLATIVSKRALNYSRAIYFDYNEEENILTPKLALTNLDLINEEIESDRSYEDFFANLSKNFKYLNKVLEKHLEGIEIKCKYNIFAKAMSKKEIRYYNEKGETYDWGSEKLKDLNFENFMLMPINYSNIKYGCIVIDNYYSKNKITIEEIEMLNIFSKTLSAYIKNTQLEEENLKKERLSAIGELASSIVHEIRTPLVGIKGFADILNQKFSEDEKAKKYTGFIKSEADRLNNLASDLLDYSKDNNYLLEKVEINDIIERSLNVLKNSKILFEKNIKTFLEKPLFVYGNESKLEQVFINLIKNSVESISSKFGDIRIRTRKDKNKLEIEIQDNGSGIPKEKLKKIFEPFVTTKIQGTGLGLPIVKEIILKHGGEIKIKSELEKGTEIKIVLDIYEEEENDRKS